MLAAALNAPEHPSYDTEPSVAAPAASAVSAPAASAVAADLMKIIHIKFILFYMDKE